MEIEQDEDGPLAARRSADAGYVRRLFASERVRGLDFLGGEPPDLLHLVHEQADLLTTADVGQKDARPPVGWRLAGRLREAKAATQVDHRDQPAPHADDTEHSR